MNRTFVMFSQIFGFSFIFCCYCLKEKIQHLLLSNHFDWTREVPYLLILSVSALGLLT